MTFQIFALVPQYDDRDAICGTRAFAEPMVYLTKAYALARAAQLGEDADEVLYRVVPAGSSPFDQANIVWREEPKFWGEVMDGDIPF